MRRANDTFFAVFLIALLWVPTAQAHQLLRLGTNIWPGYEPLHIAAERADWERSIGVRLVEYPSASEVLRAFRNKALEAAALTLDEVLALREIGLPLKVILVTDISAGADVILAKPEIERFSDLKGRRIAVESGALGAYVITRALDINGMTLQDVQIVHVDPSAQEQAYLDGRTDAVVTFEPTRTRLLSAGARELFDSREIPGEIVDVLAVHEEFLHEHPEKFRKLIVDWFAALDYRQTHPRDAGAFTARRLKITPLEADQIYDGMYLPDEATNRRLLGGELEPTLNRLQQTLLTEGLLQKPVPVVDLLDPTLLPKAGQ